MKEKTAVLLRTTTSIGERFLLALDLLAAEEPESLKIWPEDVASARRVVDELRIKAVETGYIGTPIG